MAEEKVEILIDLKIDKGQVEKDIDNATKAITDLVDETKKLNEANKELEKQGQKNSQEYIDNAKAIEKNKEELNKSNAVRKELIKTLSIEDNSLEAVRKRNRDLTAEQQKLNLSTEDGRKRLVAINKELDNNNEFIRKNTSLAQQQKQNIGNYASALDGLVPGLSGATKGIDGMTKSSLTFLATPIGAIIGAIGVVVALLAKYLTGTSEGQDKLNKVVTIGSAVIGELFGIFSKLGEFLFKTLGPIFEYIGGLILDTAEAFGINTKAITDFIEEASKLADLKNANDVLERELILLKARNEALIAEKKLRAEDKSLDLQTRIAALKDAKNALDELSQKQNEYAENKLKIFKAESERDGLSKEELKEIAQLEADLFTVRKENSEKSTELFTKDQELRAELKAKGLADDIAAQDLADENSIANRIKLFDSLNQLALVQDATEIKRTQSLADAKAKIEKKLQDVNIEGSKKSAALQKTIDDQKNAAAISGLNGLVNSSASAFGRQNAIYKAAATAQTLMATYQGATQAFNSFAGLGPIGVALGIAAAAAAVIAGLRNVAAINNVKFAKGGQAGGARMSNGVRWGTVGGKPHSAGGTKYYGEDGHVVEFEKDEGWYVAKVSAHQKFLSGMSGLNESEGGKSWNISRPPVSRSYALGGNVSMQQQAQQRIDYDRLAEIVTSTPIIVTVEDINSGQSRVAQVQQAATY